MSLPLRARRGLVLVVLLAAGCGGDDSLVGQPVPNAPPNTEITATPPVLSQSDYRVRFFWTGDDKDGSVVGYQWRISDNGMDGVVDVADTLTSHLPWHTTTRTDSTFLVSAELDSLGIDVADTNQAVVDYRFWQTHTFFVRAVDDEGAHDPTPARVSFTALTLAPTVEVVLPQFRSGIACASAAQVASFGWEGDDPDHPAGSNGPPAEVRHLFVRIGGPEDACPNEAGFLTGDYIHADDPQWSDWIPYDSPTGEGTLHTFDRKAVGDLYLFAVQVRDVAGAVTPTFEWGRNVRVVRISSSMYPQLTVQERFLGTESYVGVNMARSYEIVSGQPLELSWNADAEHYAGIVEAYRYGWNVADLDDPNDRGWAVDWGNGPAWKYAPVRSFTQGSPNFVAQCRDNSGTVSRGFYQFQVIQIATRSEQRDLLLVDDWPLGDSDDERSLDLLWQRKWDELLSAVLNHQFRDVVDATLAGDALDFKTVNDYRAVIWFLGPSTLSFFHTRLAPDDQRQARYNWLEVYQARVGNLLFVGPGAMLQSVETVDWQYPIVFNVSAGGDLGFGTLRNPDGTVSNLGTTRWPYAAWCLEATDIVRPAAGRIFGEGTGINARRRTVDCDGLLEARVAPAFLARYPDAAGAIGPLSPLTARVEKAPQYRLHHEEFYNRNVTTRPVSLVLRDCQTPMFTFHTRRDDTEGLYLDPGLPPVADADSLCYPRGLLESSLEGHPIAIASHPFRESKPLRGSEDFLWGFHPHSFDLGDVRRALLWILEDRWGLDVLH